MLLQRGKTMINNYKLNVIKEEKKELGFRYNFDLDDFIYEFPVYKFKGRTSIICKLGVDNETNDVWFNIYDISGYLYPAYYNRKYGKSKIVSIIDKNIEKELIKLGVKEK